MKEIVFATNNLHKLGEIRNMLSNTYKILSLSDIGFNGDIAETSSTLEGNASLKAGFISDRYGIDCFADDTGLEVDALDGAPGVYSARFAGEGCSYNENVQKLLKLMHAKIDRKARFRSVIAYISNGSIQFFEGIVHGEITLQPQGVHGFGYDPVFRPDGYEQTFAEMTSELKNKMSHRGIAVRKLVDFLEPFN